MVCLRASLHEHASITEQPAVVVQILEAQQRVAAGEQFATVAMQMSEDKARQGGDLGWKRRQEVVGAFADAAFKLEVTSLFPHVLCVLLYAVCAHCFLHGF